MEVLADSDHDSGGGRDRYRILSTVFHLLAKKNASCAGCAVTGRKQWAWRGNLIYQQSVWSLSDKFFSEEVLVATTKRRGHNL